MSNVWKTSLLEHLGERFGRVRELAGSRSLFVVGDDAARIYIRYSKMHGSRRAFFGLRDVDLRQLEGRNSFICLLVDDGSEPIFLPYSDYEEIFRGAQAASDGQYKVQLLNGADERELYVARRGRFNVEAYVGFPVLERGITDRKLLPTDDLTHSKVQTFLASIGHIKGYDVWVPAHDAGTLDWSLAPSFDLRRDVPSGYEQVRHILCEIDVLWIGKGGGIESLFEVEHTTSIYSGLLRFNDILLTNPSLSRFSIVSDDSRRAVFSRQLFRPTFQRSGLAELTSFLEYANVAEWHARLSNKQRAV